MEPHAVRTTTSREKAACLQTYNMTNIQRLSQTRPSRGTETKLDPSIWSGTEMLRFCIFLKEERTFVA